ncbi:unnamed protein product [Rotaria sp. Silwood1]|nr:unnamed protein product [Rotaria sp. Silwood1]CAF0740722.1 unnamed protein product [Rotaria sp. Silwood1]CAF0796017.1 unnamed protein product [Rotaria sp. Silwood1]CAF3327572.1 unnamed protein product [Rotaria sp. Silwood1]CAF3345817.1 unnamed protein product [Rotaria sp. Silwood1]
MTEENIIPPGEHPVRIRWLNAAEQNSAIQKPIAQHPQIPTIKTNKVTAPSVVNKARTKVPSATNVVRFVEQPVPTTSVDTSIQSSKGIKELSAEDKLKIANLIKELARIGHEKELVENKLEQERKLFEVQMKTLLTDYDKLMKDNQKLLTRYNETKIMLNEYEKKSQLLLKPTTNEFPNPQRVESSTPINLPLKEPSTTTTIRNKNENDLIQPSRTTNSIINEQFQLKQLMMEKQLELLHKQQQILEKEFQQRNINSLIEQPAKSSSNLTIQTTTRATSPIKHEIKTVVVERATSPVKQTTKPHVKVSDKQAKRPIQTQRYGIDNNDEDLLILSLNESYHEQIPKILPINNKSQINKNSMNAIADSEEQNLLKDIFFIC